MRSMVGLSVILENYKDLSAKTSPRVVNKGCLIKPPSPNNDFSSKTGFLDHCFLCNTRLLPGKDIYMYKGEQGFCSVECRCRQIFMDEEESCTREYNNNNINNNNNCSLTSGKNARNRANNNAFAY